MDSRDEQLRTVQACAKPGSVSPAWSVAAAWMVAAGLMVAAAGAAYFDEPLSRFFVQRKWPSDLKRAIDLSEVMAHGLSVAVILLVIRRVATSVRPIFWWLVACPVAGGLGANFLKSIISRIRPYKFWELQAAGDSPPMLETFVSWLPILESTYLRESWRQSFPSGHTATAFAFAVGLSWAFPQGRGLFFTLAIMAGLQRIVSHSHWPSDVLAGAAVGLICGTCVVSVGEWQARRVSFVAKNPDR